MKINMEKQKENTEINMEKQKEEIVKIIFPENLPSPDELELKYPPRELPKEAMVTRIAPSPTGFMHIGSLYAALISERFAHQTNGVFYLRIEDTDKKREVEGAVNLISRSLDHFGIQVDEGLGLSGVEKGLYSPYIQSKRADIYKTYIKKLLEEDRAYLCFCTEDELEQMRKEQLDQGVRPGYYKQWALWRDKSLEDALTKLKEGNSFVVRFKSPGDFNNRININDSIIGTREFSENDQDIVIMKSNGLPTYHLAHVVDDHLMRTTDVMRGDEWLSSLPLHLQLFESFGWEPPRYAHISPIQKIDGSSRRKLSKRKDPEANITYFEERGYPKEAIIEYLINLANSNFEDWRKANIGKNYREFQVSFKKLKNNSGALFDFIKLDDISKEIVAQLTSAEIYKKVLEWAKRYNKDFANLLKKYPDYSEMIFSIERGAGIKARKDICRWSDAPKEIGYFFDENFHISKEETISILSDFDETDIYKIVCDFIDSYNYNDPKDIWFNKVKEMARTHNYADSGKEFKKNPNKYKGTISDVAKIFRVLLTGRKETPDLWSIMQVMGKERVLKRLRVIGD
jgi:glutamyl-tRNA synthetase